MTVTLLCEPDKGIASALAAFIEGEVRIVTSLPLVAMALEASADETLIVVGADIPVEQALGFADWLRQANANAGVILLREAPDTRLRTRAADAGVHEVVAADDGIALTDACRRFRDVMSGRMQHVRESPSDLPHGRVVTVFSAKGGCGKTTLATNLVVILAEDRTKRVCLLDLDLGFGDVANTLQLDPERTLADAASLRRRIRPAEVSQIITPVAPRLDCILAPVGPGEAERVPPTLVGDLLSVLPLMYDYIVVDTPAQFSVHVLAALDNSDHHVLLTTPEVPTLKSLRLTLDTLDLLSYRRQSRSIVFNRADSRVGLAESDIEKALRSPVAGRIPSSWDVPASINLGVPLAAAQPDHPFTVAVRRFAQSYLTVTPDSHRLGPAGTRQGGPA